MAQNTSGNNNTITLINTAVALVNVIAVIINSYLSYRNTNYVAQQAIILEEFKQQSTKTVIRPEYIENNGDTIFTNTGGTVASDVSIRIETVSTKVDYIFVASSKGEILPKTNSDTDKAGTILLFEIPNMAPGQDFAIRLLSKENGMPPQKTAVDIIAACSNCIIYRPSP